MKKTLGIVGGMGPAATCDLMQKIIALTAASCDQEHLHMISDVNTDIPDRTAAILHGGADPVPELVRSGRRLEAAGAEFLILPCNTAHYFYDRLAENVTIPVLHMPRLTAAVLKEAGVRRAGVLATDGTVRSGVYEKALLAEGIEPVYPTAEHQAMIMRLIYDGVKGRKIALSDIPVPDILAELRGRGAEKFLLACTELPIAFQELGISKDCLDPTRVLAFSAVRFAGAETTAADPW
ncbi:MAG: aspartate/glutamate racemase family protein [Oscillospiraceae bacterium]